jgi:hypothetical protein
MSVGPWMYTNRLNLIIVKLEPNVISIGHYSFSGCMNIEEVKMSDRVTFIGSWAFSQCRKLCAIALPGCLSSIGLGAFKNCIGLKELVIPVGVTHIGHTAFSGCRIDRLWNKSKCEVSAVSWVHLRGPAPPLKEVEKWTFALHWHWKYPDRITQEQAQLFTVGIHCLAVPTELCQLVFSYIPRA